MTINGGKVLTRDGVEPVRWGGEEGRFLLRGEDTGGLFSFFEVHTPPGGGPPLHIHETVDEVFYVIDGVYDIKLGDDVHHAPAGTLVYGPRGVGHEFVNVNDRHSKMLCIATPGGVENFFQTLGELLGKGGPPDWEKMQELASVHHIIGFQPTAGAGAPGRPPGR